MTMMTASARVFRLPNQCLHHHHEFHQLVIGIRGQADFEIAGMGGQVSPLTGCLVPTADTHYYEGIGDNRHMVIDIPATTTLAVNSEGFAPLFECPRYFSLDHQLQLLLSFAEQELRQYGEGPQLSEQVATMLLTCLQRRLTDHAPETRPRLSRALDLSVLDEFIRQRLPEKISVEQLAEQACMSASHFHILFRQTTGVSPYQYVLRMRLQLARQLLLESRLPVAEIAQVAGFASQSALTNAIKKHFQVTPGQLRRQGSV